MTNLNPEQQYESLTEMLQFVFEQQIKGVFTCLPGVVRSYDQSTKRASIQPALNRILTDGTTRELPIIQDVPVCFPSGGGFALLFPVQAGDACLLIFSQRGIENFKQTYNVESPDEGLLDINDAIAVMGFGGLSVTPATSAGVSLQTESGSDYVFVENGTVNINAVGTVNINAPTVNMTVTDLNITGDVDVTGDLVNNGINFENHVHSQGNDSDGDAEVDTDAPKNGP